MDRVRITIVVNAPDAAAVASFHPPIAEMRRQGHEVHPRLTFEAGDARWMAREGCEEGSELVIAAGGDGTLNEVVNGINDHLAASASRGGEPVRLGVVPLGTANDFAAALGIPTEVDAALAAALTGAPRLIDVGQVEDRCFLNVSTGGFGAEASEDASPEVKRVIGPLAYVITGVRKFVGLEVSAARFTSGGETIFDGRFLLFAVGNFRRTGGGNWLTPRAELTDGMLDLCIVEEMSRVEFLTLLPDLRNGTHVDHPRVLYRQLTEVRVESEVELSVNADGEPLSGRTFHYRLLPRRLRVVLPEVPAVPA